MFTNKRKCTKYPIFINGKEIPFKSEVKYLSGSDLKFNIVWDTTCQTQTCKSQKASYGLLLCHNKQGKKALAKSLEKN